MRAHGTGRATEELAKSVLCVDEAQWQRVQLGVGLVLAGSNAGGSAGCNAGLRRERRFAFGAVRPFFWCWGVGIPAGLVNLFRSIRMLQMSLQAADHLASVLNVAPLAEPERPRPRPKEPVCMEFEGVAFAYGENLPFVLQDVDVALELGTVTALVGDSAAARRRSPA